MASNKSTAAQTISADQFIAEYMAGFANRPREEKVSLLDRVTGFAGRVLDKTVTVVEDTSLDIVADSKAYVARVGEAWDAADAVAEQARMQERARQAARMAKRLGLK